MSATETPQEKVEMLRQLLDMLPIFATTIGYRCDSTDAEREFADALFKVTETWTEVKP